MTDAAAVAFVSCCSCSTATCFGSSRLFRSHSIASDARYCSDPAIDQGRDDPRDDRADAEVVERGREKPKSWTRALWIIVS